MKERKKTRIVVASVLKPVNDTRMRGKIARTLLKIPDTELHVFGFPSSDTKDGVCAHPSSSFPRLSLRRLLLPWSIYRQVISLRPRLFIITTHELLAVAVLARIVLGCRIVYDVQENYFRNILYTDAFPRLLRPFLAAYVRLKEWACTPFINLFLLAERAYREEMKFIRKQSLTLENKATRSTQYDSLRDPRKLLFTGTLSESTGIFRAIELARRLRDMDDRMSLTIAGYCPRAPVYDQLRDAISGKRWIRLIGGNQLVPHEEIVKHMHEAGTGIIAYPPNPSTQGSIPTKLYEYLAARLRIIVPPHPAWVELCNRYQAAVVYNWNDSEVADVYRALVSDAFYPRPPDESVYWDSEEEKLIAAVKKFL